MDITVRQRAYRSQYRKLPRNPAIELDSMLQVLAQPAVNPEHMERTLDTAFV